MARNYTWGARTKACYVTVGTPLLLEPGLYGWRPARKLTGSAVTIR